MDIILGPTLTAVVASPSKPVPELRRDIGFIALVQVVALAYGVYTISAARPVHMVFEVDRFVVVHASDIESTELIKAPTPLQELPWSGPTLIAVRPARDQKEMLQSLDSSLQGVDTAMQPSRWENYELHIDSVRKKLKPIELLIAKYPEQRATIEALVGKSGLVQGELGVLPVVSRSSIWTAVVELSTGRPIGYIAVDGFV